MEGNQNKSGLFREEEISFTGNRKPRSCGP